MARDKVTRPWNLSRMEEFLMNAHEKVRSDLIDYLERDQFGPYKGISEVLPENPLRRYMVGVLHPQGSAFDEADDDGGQGREPTTKNDDSEPGLRMSNTVAPSSYGMTFACKEDVKSIQVFVRVGKYQPVPKSSAKVDNGSPVTSSQEWQRKEIYHEEPVPISKPGDESYNIIKNELSLRVRSREVDQSGVRSVTISVVNEQKCPAQSKQKDKAEKCFFQIYFGVEGLDGSHPFVTRSDLNSNNSVSEENGLRLLYRHVKIFAIGHGCATDWQDDALHIDCARIVSSFVPQHTVYPMVQSEDFDSSLFSIKNISESSPSRLLELFSILPDQYDIWISKLKKEVVRLPDYLQPQAEEHIRICNQASKRIRAGIQLLTYDQIVGKAFILMHKAMLHQISRSRWQKKGRPDEGPLLGPEHAWYPFQIAFILQCLDSLADPASKERDLVDLLWFPTGGGKTEAYLGIIAFLIFLRRLRSLAGEGDGGGTVALMRYTLRLLTVDQFYRAALLACSCEKIRKEKRNGIAKTAPVSIGLWVGGDASPNYWKQAREELEKINSGKEEPTKGNPVKIRECPWCGDELNSGDYTLPDEHTSMLIRCPNEDCDFHAGLPIWIVDTDVYQHRPSLIIGTVDKFARIPWVEESGNIFGTDGTTLPPEVIIQDELHLISGPLGTMVGLYETAVDALCRTSTGNLPKVIASTATIRNAESQVKSLFGRRVYQFPPSGLDYSDSFFAREDKSIPGRHYIGVFTPGTSPTSALVRTFAILLHGAYKADCSDDVRDAYWTLMTYFNSLRELGGASVQVDDDVNDYLKLCAERDGNRLDLRQVENKAELTGRVPSTELDEIRTELSEQYKDGDCLDVVLATNMISVGLDVPRLGIMAVVGQPKATSEYIQATSRIGRLHAGLVVTIYNWTRSRDRSHFERFKGYHSKLYSEVEATSVTPFSSRARDRGLHAILIILVRHLITGMRKNSNAVRFDSKSSEVQALVKEIVARVGLVDNQEKEDTERAIQKIISRWQGMATSGELFYKKKKRRDDRLPLMISAEEATATSTSFGTLNSLRNIDPAAGLKLER